MTRPATLKLRGAVFGPLKVIQPWGSQSGNIAWVYHCRACGHVGKRLGVTLRRKEQACPRCKFDRRRYKDGRGWPFPRPDMDAVEKLMESAPPLGAPRSNPPSLSKRLENCTTKELTDLIDRIEAELRKRPTSDFSSPAL